MTRHKSYLEQRRELKLKGPKPAGLKRAEAKSKAGFFQAMLALAPSKCMETGCPLKSKVNLMEIVVHILPKSKVKSMAEDPRNIVYLDGDVHTNFDNKGQEFIKKMKILPLLKKRVEMMWPEIPENERRWVPECLRPE